MKVIFFLLFEEDQGQGGAVVEKMDKERLVR